MKYNCETHTVDGCWLSLTREGLQLLQVGDDGWVQGEKISVEQFKAWDASDNFDCDDWRDIYAAPDEDLDTSLDENEPFWSQLLLEWNMETDRKWECFDAKIPAEYFDILPSRD